MPVAQLNLVEPEAPLHSDARRSTLSENVLPHLPGIAKRAAATEQARMVSPENIDIIREAGFVRALVPKVRGGAERDLTDFCDGIRTLARACPSTAWVTGVLNVHPAGIGHFETSVQEEVWATGVDTIISSSGSPSLKATMVEGGIRVSGKARWSSGCDHAAWAIIGVKVPDPSNRHFPEHRYVDYMFIAPRADYTIDDTWYSTGMRGSGSKDLVLDDVFVPFRRMERMDALMFGYSKGTGTTDSWITRVPFPPLFGVFLPAVALGCADGMVVEFKKRQQTRKNAYTGAQGVLNPAGHLRYAESIHELESLTVYYRSLLEAMQEHGRKGRPLNEANFIEMQSRFPFITQRAVDVIDRLFMGAGSSAIADFNPMQRFWRDGHTARLHTGSDYDTSMLTHGRSMLGLMMSPDL